MPRGAGDQHDAEVDPQHVHTRDGGGAEPAGEQQRRAPDRPHDERLEEAALRVAAHHAEREEDGEHDPEEERREHRQAEQEGAGERPRVDVHVGGRRDLVELVEDVVVREPEEEEEEQGQEEDDGEHLPPHRLAEAVLDDHADAAQDVSPPTASR